MGTLPFVHSAANVLRDYFIILFIFLNPNTRGKIHSRKNTELAEHLYIRFSFFLFPFVYLYVISVGFVLFCFSCFVFSCIKVVFFFFILSYNFSELLAKFQRSATESREQKRHINLCIEQDR